MKKTLQKVFYPHETNNNHPYFWRPISIWIISIVILFVSGSILLKKIDISPVSLLGDIRSGAVISFTNKERVREGLIELTENKTLQEAATLKAQDMASKGYFSHYTPEGNSPWYWFTKAGYEYQKAGENLAVNFDDSKKVVNAWMDSPTHRANLLKEGYTEIGIGIAEGVYKDKKATFVVQLFATPKVSDSKTLFTIETEGTTNQNSQVSVRGAEINVLSAATLFSIFESQTYTLLFILFVVSILILFAIFVFVKNGLIKQKKFIVPFVVLVICLGIAGYTQFDFVKNITVVLG